MVNSDLLILYCPGSRGDFLAAILTDKIESCYQHAMIFMDLQYSKMHGINNGVNPWDDSLTESSILYNRARSIRIKIAPSDYKVIAKLTATKNLCETLTANEVCNWEQQHRKLDIKFGHVVWFADLFKVEFLQNFYQRFNGKPMPAKLVPMIEHNIALQFNYKP